MVGGVAVTTEEKRIKIAEACGWSRSFIGDGIDGWRMPDRVTAAFESDLPDYFNDLNAMHSAEGHWIESARSEYERNERAAILEIAIVWVMMSDRRVIPPSYRATAAQRAEAFLKTIGKWKE